MLEKGSEVGAHILSGAVVDPIAIDRLIPDWRTDANTPFKTPVTKDKFMVMGAGRCAEPAGLFHAAADEQPRRLHRLAGQRLSLARRQGGGTRRRDLSRLRGLRGPLRRRGARHRRGDRRHGRHPRGRAGPQLHPRHGRSWASTSSSARACAARSQSSSSRSTSSTRGAIRRSSASALKELWQVAPEKHQPGLVQHTFGWPLDSRTGGRLVPLSP